MNRKEAIEVLTKTAEELKFLITDRLLSRSTRMQYIDLIDAAERLSEPLTLVDLLGWEEGVEYECDGVEFKIEDGKLLYFSSSYEFWEVLDLNWTDENIKNLQHATKVEQKPKAYHVTDEYSYNCLMKELQEQGYATKYGTRPTETNYWDNYKQETVIYCEEDGSITYSQLSYYETEEKDRYELIKYHKEELKFYAKIKGTQVDIRNVDGLRQEFTMKAWNELGINGSNADFEEVAE